MHQSIVLTYPHLFLFAYRQESSSVATEDTWQDLRPKLGIKQVKDKQELIPWHQEEKEGFYHALEMGDSEGLLVACSPKDSNQVEPVSCFAEYKNQLDVTGNIGKTWLLCGYLNTSTNAEKEAIATAAYQSFSSSGKTLKLVGKFLGNPLYGVEEGREEVLICIFSNLEGMKQLSQFYYDWLWLFYYYHKVNWIYEQSRRIKKLLVQENFFPNATVMPQLSDSLAKINLGSADLQQLKIALYEQSLILTKHTEGLEALTIQIQSLKQNQANYQKRLTKITQTAKNTQLDDFEQFRKIDIPRYQEQIEQDYTSLSPGLRVRERYIETIRGIVEISQAQSDRRIEHLIAVAGVGLGTASVMSAALQNPVNNLEIKEKPAFLEPTSHILIIAIASLVVGLGASWLTWLFFKRGNR